MARLNAHWSHFFGRGKAWNHFWQDAATVSGPATLTDSLSAGNYSIVGKTVADSVVRADALSAGSYSIAGQSSADLVARGDALANGAYALAGQSVTDSVVRSDALAAGAYAISGKTITDLRAISDALAAGAYAYAGKDITDAVVTVGGVAVADVLASGAYLLAGQAIADAITSSQAVGGYDDTKRKHRYIVRKDGQLLVFTDRERAEMALQEDEPEQVEAVAQTAPKVKAKAKKPAQVAKAEPVKEIKPARKVDSPALPLQTINLEYLLAMAQIRGKERAAQEMLARKAYESLMAMFERMQDEEDIELLLMAVH